MAGVTTLIAGPVAFFALTVADTKPMFAAFIAVQLLLFSSTGPVNSAIINVIPTQRATAMAFSILMTHLLGDVPSPLILGSWSKAHGDDAASLQQILLIVPVAILVGGIIWFATALGPSRGKAVAAG